MQKTIC